MNTPEQYVKFIQSYNKDTDDANEVVLVPILLSLIRFHTLHWYFHN